MRRNRGLAARQRRPHRRDAMDTDVPGVAPNGEIKVAMA
jgi:hypothetical protein